MKFNIEAIYRFLWGDLPLFVCQKWLEEESNLQFFSEAHQQELMSLNTKQSSLLQHQAIEDIFRSAIDEGHYLTWVIQNVLPWIIKEDSRACHGIDMLKQIEEEGLYFLGVITRVHNTGVNTGHFDWNAVRENLPLVKPGAKLCLDMLAQKEIRIENKTDYYLAPSLQGTFSPVAQWEDALNRHLLLSEL